MGFWYFKERFLWEHKAYLKEINNQIAIDS